MFGGVQVNYYPDEENDWALNRDALENAYTQANEKGINIKAIVVINPGNPTGALLDRQSMGDVVDVAREWGLAIIADMI